MTARVRTAVDSSVLLDLLTADPGFGARSREALDRVGGEGALLACEVVWAEVRAFFPGSNLFERSMSELGVQFDGSDRECAARAGEAWRRYRAARGKRTTLVSDFLVAAHAATRADRLLTRDRGFTRRYFRGLRVLDPSA